MPPPRATPSTIVFRLAAALHRLLRQELAAPRYREERVAVGLLAILSREPFRGELLFRDFARSRESLWLDPAGGDGDPDGPDPGAGEGPAGSAPAGRVYKPAHDYLILVLSRRLTLANNLMERPTNMHLLLAALAAHGPEDDGWPQARVARAHTPPPSGPVVSAAFARTARVLARQVRQLGTRYGARSRERRAAWGPFWLILPVGVAELAEELGLWDCLAAVPVPLARALDDDSRDRLSRVLESLNERYGLLRSCGLDPARWFDDPDLSVARLKDLKALRRVAEALLAGDPHGCPPTREAAYARAFAAQRSGARAVAGCADWADFAGSPVGEWLIHHGPRSLDAPLTDEDEGDFTLADTRLLAAADPDLPDDLWAGDPQALAVRRCDLAYVIGHCPGIRDNPVLDWFARACLLDGRSVHGADGVLADPEFRRLAGASARYAGAHDQALLNALERDLNEAVRYCKGRLNKPAE